MASYWSEKLSALGKWSFASSENDTKSIASAPHSQQNTPQSASESIPLPPPFKRKLSISEDHLVINKFITKNHANQSLLKQKAGVERVQIYTGSNTSLERKLSEQLHLKQQRSTEFDSSLRKSSLNLNSLEVPKNSKSAQNYEEDFYPNAPIKAYNSTIIQFTKSNEADLPENFKPKPKITQSFTVPKNLATQKLKTAWARSRTSNSKPPLSKSDLSARAKKLSAPCSISICINSIEKDSFSSEFGSNLDSNDWKSSSSSFKEKGRVKSHSYLSATEERNKLLLESQRSSVDNPVSLNFTRASGDAEGSRRNSGSNFFSSFLISLGGSVDTNDSKRGTGSSQRRWGLNQSNRSLSSDNYSLTNQNSPIRRYKRHSTDDQQRRGSRGSGGSVTYMKRASLNSLCNSSVHNIHNTTTTPNSRRGSGYQFRSEYVRNHASFTNISKQHSSGGSINRIHRMNSKTNDKLKLPESSNTRRYSLPTNELIDEYKEKKAQKERENDISSRYRSGSIGASIISLLRPADNATSKSREDIRRSSCANMRSDNLYKSNNLQLPKNSTNHRRRNSAGNYQSKDESSGRRRSSALMSSLLDFYNGNSGRKSSVGGSQNGSRRSSAAADFMESLIKRKNSACGITVDTEDSGGKRGSRDTGGKGSSWFSSLIISQQDREENKRKAEKKKTRQLIVSLAVFVGIVATICAVTTAMSKDGMRATIGFCICYLIAVSSFATGIFYLCKMSRVMRGSFLINLHPRCLFLLLYFLFLPPIGISVFWPNSWTLTCCLTIAQTTFVTLYAFLELRRSARFWSTCQELFS
ncbi:uncharacterized protein LOC142337732 isoform X1 [Convolutriloba macropyga]|uniref:uncharacterized protein LOC142337732 isoform X1 n=1 Tax=Convolutriloba macropyga TaxID=536237 RepID=UPI003F522C68